LQNPRPVEGELLRRAQLFLFHKEWAYAEHRTGRRVEILWHDQKSIMALSEDPLQMTGGRVGIWTQMQVGPKVAADWKEHPRAGEIGEEDVDVLNTARLYPAQQVVQLQFRSDRQRAQGSPRP
jgi:hypothetical protein